jgi:maltooligosyltrehalose trehalohydrolase
MHSDDKNLGPRYLGNGRCGFTVWAPLAAAVEVRLLTPRERLVPLTPSARGYHTAVVDDVEPGTLYFYRLNGAAERPDPASRFQPQGVHGPSQVIDSDFAWQDDDWSGIPLRDYILYELHVGTFTTEGTFDAVIPQLDALKELGITAIELMPVAQFPGSRNWGYDGVYLFAVQDSYGGPDGLKRLVNACHQKGLALVLDVVYNHLGPEGNYLREFGHYFTEHYKTPWGAAVNFDGPHSDEVRSFFLENVHMWQTEFHIDSLRLDALHAIHDFSARPFLQEMAEHARLQADRLKRRFHLIAESNLNDVRLLRAAEFGGYGLDAQWNDDFHHAAHALLTGEKDGYYQDFGCIDHLVRAWRDGFVYAGEYSTFRQRRHGNSSRSLPAEQFVVSGQNHDQIGNRPHGERLSQLLSLEGLKLAAGTMLLSPFLPLLFMGEEYGETAPFLYFTNHGDPGLIEAVRQGRREEFAAFLWQGEIPDPDAEATFLRSKLQQTPRTQHQQVLWDLHQELIRLRKTLPALAKLSKEHQEVIGYEAEKVLFVCRWSAATQVFAVFHFGRAAVSLPLPIGAGRWRRLLDSSDQQWLGPGCTAPEWITSTGMLSVTLGAQSFVLFQRAEEE